MVAVDFTRVLPKTVAEMKSSGLLLFFGAVSFLSSFSVLIENDAGLSSGGKL